MTFDKREKEREKKDADVVRDHSFFFFFKIRKVQDLARYHF